MTKTQVIDVHAHILSEETMRLMRAEAPGMGPKLSNPTRRRRLARDGGRTRGNFPRGAWDARYRDSR